MDTPAPPDITGGGALNGTRKFTLAAFASVCAMILCWWHRIDGQVWMGAQGLILGLYGGANIWDKRWGGRG
jgi:hypothetical protein